MPPTIERISKPKLGVYTDHNKVTTNYSQVTEDILRYFDVGIGGNYGYPNFNRANVGHDMQLRIREARYPPTALPQKIKGLGPYGDHTYQGSVIVNPAYFGPPGAPAVEPTLDAWGAEAYAKMKPTQPEFQALNSIYELRELPALLKQRFSFNDLKSMTNYYVALQFGWRPLLNDVRNFVTLQRDAQKKLAQLLRDNGRPVRRRINLLDVTSNPTVSDSTLHHALYPTFVTYFYHKECRIRTTSYTRDRVWASARFRFWLPGGPRDVHWRRRMLARIYGFRPSPSVVYNAIPWSWLVDWFTNLGHVIENMDGGVADRLAADYFYLMRTWESINNRFVTGYFEGHNGKNVTVTATASGYRARKLRVPGNPFGFDVAQKDLSPMQLSILGALGYSKL